MFTEPSLQPHKGTEAILPVCFPMNTPPQRPGNTCIFKLNVHRHQAFKPATLILRALNFVSTYFIYKFWKRVIVLVYFVLY